ncbi:hypothetical protein [Clavibacter sp. VKM Ac-2872]|uniref:hypothetical protein n=1 Tax=Clavibacter sp. VKM Ac-2872 TaxID=2783812 RepID=UPI00188C3EB4|nr:hypothetical protein [Clavibacter sp. VKM Ac-2872]MBF4625709.1 hypothetical protein [Clavibacter sp. VKM Ac-2872]
MIASPPTAPRASSSRAGALVALPRPVVVLDSTIVGRAGSPLTDSDPDGDAAALNDED